MLLQNLQCKQFGHVLYMDIKLGIVIPHMLQVMTIILISKACPVIQSSGPGKSSTSLTHTVVDGGCLYMLVENMLAHGAGQVIKSYIKHLGLPDMSELTY